MSSIFLGTDPSTRKACRLKLERHALTVAGARMGKGACQIIPTLLEWDSSAIVIDPKGEAVKATADHRKRHGQKIAILDPMNLLPEAFARDRVSFDPLSLVRSGGAGFRDLQMIADGLVLTTGEERDPHWNESALATITGCLAYLVGSKEEERPHLGQLLLLLRSLRNPGTRAGMIELMNKVHDFGGLSTSTAALFSADNNETNSILSTTARHLRFLADADIAAVLQPAGRSRAATLDMSGLRDGSLTLYVVMHPGSLVLHARFMRLFVRMALSIMMDTHFENGKSTNAPCLFVLDEFYSLGKISEIQKAAGLMPGYGVHLWPILQDWGQLVDLYGQHGAQTFLANADAVSVFGVSDQTTLREVSSWFGEMSVDELSKDAFTLARKIESSDTWRQLWNSVSDMSRDTVNNQQLLMQSTLLQGRIGRPKHYPADIQRHIGKPFGAHVAQRMYVFLRTNDVLDLVPTPYFPT